jgi:hypothetical protein
MTGFRIDPAKLAASGNSLGAVSATLKEALEEFRTELTSYNGPWGNDTLGQMIDAAYDEVVNFAFEIIEEAVDDIFDAGDDLSKMAESYLATEEAVRKEFVTLRKNLEA